MFLAPDDVPDILVVDDTPADCHFMEAILSAQGYHVRVARSGYRALEEIAGSAPDLVLLDINMPDMDGIELCRRLKESLQHARIPVIFISVFDDTDIKVSAFNCGGIDYLTKPLRVAELKARIHAHLRLKRAQDRLGYQAGHDPLTGLPNRSLLADRLQHALSFAERYGGQVAVAYIDLDNFKTVNDRFGHKAGDHLLTEAAGRLQACVRESDTIARIGGDEFVIVFYDRAGENPIVPVMQRILESIAEPVVFDGHSILPSCSIGIAGYPRDGLDADSLLRNADTAMYRAKELGRNNFQFYTLELNSRINERLAMETDLRSALEHGEFVLHYQPRIELRSGRMVGLEALIRWQHPKLGLLPPQDFIPIAEETGLIDQIGNWVVRAACVQRKRWEKRRLLQVPVAINISLSQFFAPGFAQSISAVLHDTGVLASCLELDLKESLLMHDPAATLRILQELKEIGVGLSIDDFGTGFFNLGYLKRFPVDRIKLDPSFISEIQNHPDDLAVADAVISMAHSLRLKVAAECAESASQLALLAARGCDEMQGDYFSPALPVDLCTVLLQENRRLEVGRIGRENAGRTLLLVEEKTGGFPDMQENSPFSDCRVLHAQDAEEAFAVLAAHEVGVIVCGQDMHGMSGAEFFSRVRQMYPRTVRIMYSDQSDVAVAADAINRGSVFKFLRKPWKDGGLTEILDDAFIQYERGAAPAAYQGQPAA